MKDLMFASLRLQLERRGMNRTRIERVAGELVAHAEDLEREFIEKGKTPKEARQEAMARLGGADTLCEEIFRKYSRRTFWGKHPVVSFALFPILAMALVLGSVPLVGFVLKHVVLFLDSWGFRVNFASLKLLYLNLFSLGQYALTGLCAYFFLWTAKKYAFEMKWAFLAVVTLAVFGFCLSAKMELFPVLGDKLAAKGTLTYGLGVSFAHWPSPESLVRFFAPLLFFVLFYARNFWGGYPGVRHPSRE